MAKLRKYQLLEKAMRDYPAGTRFKSTFSGDSCISTGIFQTTKHGVICDGMFLYEISKNEWATIIPSDKPSILTGKCAIQVNNEREFGLLMEHYEEKGWKTQNGHSLLKTFSCFPYATAIQYSNEPIHGNLIEEDFTIIPFNQFAAEVGIKVPVFVMTSEDGVDLYVGDYGHAVINHDKNWEYYDKIPVYKGFSAESKAFSTLEAAEAWIKEQNKPRSIWIDYGCNTTALLLKELVQFHLVCGVQFELTKEQLAEINSKMAQLQETAP